MEGREKYRISCVVDGVQVWITGFDEVGVFTTSAQARDAAEFDSYDKLHHVQAFLEACNPLVPFAPSRCVAIPCRAVSRPVAPQRTVHG